MGTHTEAYNALNEMERQSIEETLIQFKGRQLGAIADFYKRPKPVIEKARKVLVNRFFEEAYSTQELLERLEEEGDIGHKD